MATFDQGPLQPLARHWFLTGVTEPGQVQLTIPGIVYHVDVIEGVGRGLRANCMVEVIGFPRCESQMRPIDGPPGPMNQDGIVYVRSDTPGRSVTVLWADQDGDGIRGPLEVADVDEINWVAPWTHVTLGDSYTAGTGIQAGYVPDPIESGDACLRSTLAYGWNIRQLAMDGSLLSDSTAATPGGDFRYVPCSGAEVDNILGLPLKGAPPQLAESGADPAIDPTVDLITLTIGGNDAAFASILKHCISNIRDTLQIELVSQVCMDHPLNEGDPASLRGLMPALFTDLQSELDALYASLRVQTPNAVVLQAGYPLVVDPSATDCYGLNDAELDWFTATNRRANEVIREAAARNGGIYVDVEGYFEGRGACSTANDGTFVRGLSLWGVRNAGGASEHSFHPNAAGHLAYQTAFNTALETAVVRFGARPDGLPNVRLSQGPPSLQRQQTAGPAVIETDGMSVTHDGPECATRGVPAGTTVTFTSDGHALGALVTVQGSDGSASVDLTTPADGDGRLATAVQVVGDQPAGISHSSRLGENVRLVTGSVEVTDQACGTPAPTVTIDAPAAEEALPLGAAVDVRFGCDAPTCLSTLPAGPQVLPAGRHTLRVTAIETAGEATVVLRTFTVGPPLTSRLLGTDVERRVATVEVSRDPAHAGSEALVAVTLSQDNFRPVLGTAVLPPNETSATIELPLTSGGRTRLLIRTDSPHGWSAGDLDISLDLPLVLDPLAGSDRYATAAAAAAQAYPDGAGTVLLARADDPADALSAAGLAAAMHAPILLTDTDAVPQATRAALLDLGADAVVLLGGTAAISDRVASELLATHQVSRLSGPDRISTAVSVARATQPLIGTARSAVITSATNWHEALLAAGLAAALPGPVLLTGGDQLSEDTRAYLSDSTIDSVIIVGQVDAAVSAELEQLVEVEQAGSEADPAALATAVADLVAERSPSSRTVLVATSRSFADALTAGGLVGPLDATVLLVDEGAVATAAEWVRAAPHIGRVVVMGGPAAVSEADADQVARS